MFWNVEINLHLNHPDVTKEILGQLEELKDNVEALLVMRIHRCSSNKLSDHVVTLLTIITGNSMQDYQYMLQTRKFRELY